VHPGDLAGGFTDLEMTWLLYCAGAATDCISGQPTPDLCDSDHLTLLAWAPAGMGKRGHLPPSGNVVKCFCALVDTAKRSADELFVHYFHNLSLASGGFAQDPHWGPTDPHPAEGLSSGDP